jgi:nucleoside-diphosphate-sugar epimerase
VSGVLVTGGSGFIGWQVLAELAEQGEEVHALTTRDDPPPLEGVRWWRADLAHAAAVEQVLAQMAPTQLLHLAWFVEHGRFWQAPENVVWVERSLQLLRSFAGVGGERALMLGTCAEYDWSVPADRLSEESSAIAPATLYGASKDALRRVASAFCEQEGVQFAWARIFFLYGPREAPVRLVASVLRDLLAGRPAQVSSGTQIRDLLHVQDVAAALVALLRSPVTGAVNVGSGEAVALVEVFDEIGRLTGRPELIRRGALPDRPGEPTRLVADVGRLRDEVGFTPRWPLAGGLADAMEWWRAHPTPP